MPPPPYKIDPAEVLRTGVAGTPQQSLAKNIQRRIIHPHTPGQSQAAALSSPHKNVFNQQAVTVKTLFTGQAQGSAPIRVPIPNVSSKRTRDTNNWIQL